MTSTPHLKGFADELLKLAFNTSDPKELKKKLRVGDILYTRPRNPKGFEKDEYAVIRAFQGSPYTHVGMYVGGGEVVDANDWEKDGKTRAAVYRTPLEKFTDRYDFKVLRPRVSSKERRDAARFAKDQVGKDFNIKGMIRAGVLPRGRPKHKKDRLRRDDADSFFCSELVANSYFDSNIASRRKLRQIVPKDLYRSTKTKTVAEFNKEKEASSFKPPKTQPVHKPAKVNIQHKPFRMARM